MIRPQVPITGMMKLHVKNKKLVIVWKNFILNSWKKILIIGVHKNEMYA